MYLIPSRSTQLARLFSLLSQGERIAHISAAQQSQLMTQHGNTAHAKFFKQQSRQERFHARVFSSAALWIGSGKTNTCCKHLKLFEKSIENALHRRDMTESILAVQVILESIGKIILEGIDARMERQRYGFKKIRAIILAQEAEHHEFGQNQLLHLTQNTNAKLSDMQQQSQHYQELANNIFDELAPLFDHLGADINRYKSELNNEIPDHLKTH
ncbi:MAG: hypothetical protein GXP21_04760 [Gammaproteobacteria bacterium]|nr:hypothetical protein [Gammaproteobacteria bacterium]